MTYLKYNLSTHSGTCDIRRGTNRVHLIKIIILFIHLIIINLYFCYPVTHFVLLTNYFLPSLLNMYSYLFLYIFLKTMAIITTGTKEMRNSYKQEVDHYHRRWTGCLNLSHNWISILSQTAECQPANRANWPPRQRPLRWLRPVSIIIVTPTSCCLT